MHRYTATPRNNKGAHMAEVEWTEIKEPQDIKLVVADMDATLLDADGQIPAGFWPMLDRLNQKGVTFVPASGRQYQTLQQMFSRSVRPMSFIAENGNIVSLDGNVIETHTVSRSSTSATRPPRRANTTSDSWCVVSMPRIFSAPTRSSSPR